jgi:ribulose-5-phosphate 4-epimerase/fuculose-1-phosphate aldolase
MANVNVRDFPGSLRERIDPAEWERRVEMAAAFRIAHHLGWNDRIVNHITGRVPNEPRHFLMNPHGLGWHEVTASNLAKADFDGNLLSEGETRLAPAGLNFHSAILKAKPEINCVIHTHTTPGVVISATECGLRIYDQTGCLLHRNVAYHDFEGYASEKDEAGRIISDLGDCKAMIMRNHGLLTVGRTVGEAFAFMRRLIAACELQMRLMSLGTPLRELSDEIKDYTRSQTDQKRPGKPYGMDEWRMNVRLADQLYPDYKA